jgi:hypothetical protein
MAAREMSWPTGFIPDAATHKEELLPPEETGRGPRHVSIGSLISD